MEGGQRVAGDVEEALNLPGVQVDRDVAIGAGDFDDVRQQARGDADARLVFLVRSRIAEIRDDDVDTRGRVALERVDQDQQFKDVLVQVGRCHRLYEVHILTADALAKADEEVLVGKLDALKIAAA